MATTCCCRATATPSATLPILARRIASRSLKPALFPFIDLATGERWVVQPNQGRIPWWVLSKARRVPGTRLGDYWDMARITRTRDDTPVADSLRRGQLYTRLLEPLAIAALEHPAASRARPPAGGRDARNPVARRQRLRTNVAQGRAVGGAGRPGRSPPCAGAARRCAWAAASAPWPSRTAGSPRCGGRTGPLRLIRARRFCSRCRPGSQPTCCPAWSRRTRSKPS